MSGNGQPTAADILKEHAAQAPTNPQVVNLMNTFRAALDRGEVASISIAAIRHDGIPMCGFMGPETVPAYMLLHSALMCLTGQVEAKIMGGAVLNNRPSPILKAR